MNQDLYAELVEDKFPSWAGGCEYLVCDYETCLRTDLALHQLGKVDLTLVDPLSTKLPKLQCNRECMESSTRSPC